jgi:hypothetical protein
VVLANSASYGLHLIANGLQLGPGDQVLVAANDFPSDILLWADAPSAREGGAYAALADSTSTVCASSRSAGRGRRASRLFATRAAIVSAAPASSTAPGR